MEKSHCDGNWGGLPNCENGQGHWNLSCDFERLVRKGKLPTDCDVDIDYDGVAEFSEVSVADNKVSFAPEVN